MAEGGATNNAFAEEDQARLDARTPPPSYPGTPNNFTRKLQQENAEEKTGPPPQVQPVVMPEKAGPPTSFVEVPMTMMIPGALQYGDPYKIQFPQGQNVTVIDSKESGKEPVKKGKPTCCDIFTLIVAIAACFMFFPLGIPALVLSSLAIHHKKNNRTEKGSKFTKISIVLSIIAIFLFVVLVATYGARKDDGLEDCGDNCNSTSGGNSAPFWDSGENRDATATDRYDDNMDPDNDAHEETDNHADNIEPW